MPFVHTLNPSPVDPTLHVIAVVSNPQRFHSRYKLYKDFEAHMLAQGPGLNLITVEAAFGFRDHVVTDPTNPNHIQVQFNDEIWHKESMINIGLRALPAGAKYIAWIDADVEFQTKNWVHETVQALQHYAIVQPFSDAVDLGPNGQVLDVHKSFCRQYVETDFASLAAADAGYGNGVAFPHPGFAWAARREVLDGLGGLPDWPLLGAADHHLAWSLIGSVEKSYPGNVSDNYLKMLMQLQARALTAVDKNIGYVPGMISHQWHGKKKDRRYQERWSILIDNHFDPEVDIVRNTQGLYQLAGNKPKLRDDCRAYFKARNEDSIDLV